jgi:hypothetical protein
MASDRETGELVNILLCPMKMLEKEGFFSSEGWLKGSSGASKKTSRSSLSLLVPVEERITVADSQEERGIRFAKGKRGKW